MSDETRDGGSVGVRADFSESATESETQDGFSRLLDHYGVEHYREVWFRPMAAVSVLDTQSNARRVDFYIVGRDLEHGPFNLVVEIKHRRESGVYKQLRGVTAQLIGARTGFGWFTQDGVRLPAPDWPVYADQHTLSGTVPSGGAYRPDADQYVMRVWWENGCGSLFRDHRGLMARVPAQRFNRGKRTPDVKYLDLLVCP
jgi:hypothetical protein